MPEYKEYCIRVEDLNSKVLRDFQMLDFPLQKQNGALKPLPPGSYNDTVLEAKRQNRLAGYLEEEKSIAQVKTGKTGFKSPFFRTHDGKNQYENGDFPVGEKTTFNAYMETITRTLMLSVRV